MLEKNKPFKSKQSNGCHVIAEESLNHNGSLESTKRIIDPEEGRFPKLRQKHRDITS